WRLELYQPTTVAGTTLKAGDVKLELKDNKAVLKQGKIVVEASVKTETASQKFLYTAVGYKKAPRAKSRTSPSLAPPPASSSSKSAGKSSVAPRRDLVISESDVRQYQVPPEVGKRPGLSLRLRN